MNCVSKVVVLIAMLFSVNAAVAQNKETPPHEPPYVDDNEFDPIQGEDPSSTTAPIPVSPTNDPKPDPYQSQSLKNEPAFDSTPTPTYTQERAREYKPGTKPEKGVKLLHHPDAQKGLIRIEQDGTYVYKVKTKKSNHTGTIRIGVMEPPKIEASDGIHNFSSMYGSGGMVALLGEYEWQPFSSFGKLGVQAGMGFATAQGNGFFASDGSPAQEKYTFFAVPVNLGVIYRLEYFKRQWIAPYVSGGGSYIGVAELRDDNRSYFSGTPGAYGAGGIMFNISALDKRLAFELNSEYDIATLWIVGEYRYQQAFSDTLNFSGGIMTLGIAADF